MYLLLLFMYIYVCYNNMYVYNNIVVCTMQICSIDRKVNQGNVEYACLQLTILHLRD